LLDAYPIAEQFLESPAADLGTADAEPSRSEEPGAIIGPFKLLEAIGEGGMGVVYMAEQMHPVRRKVALKIIKPGMDTKHVGSCRVGGVVVVIYSQVPLGDTRVITSSPLSPSRRRPWISRSPT
jgi:serine/threonine protein kinase